MGTWRTSLAGSGAELNQPHLVLVGLPGAGKSTLGRAVAERTGRPFVDFDTEIAQREGQSVAEIFAEQGEPYFRDCERALTRELASRSGMVLAPGSGWVVDPVNLTVLGPVARVVWLRADPETVVERLRASPVVRPLLVGDDALARVRRLAAERTAAFERADVVVDTGLLTFDAALAELVALASGLGPG
jgi:shikimate kinase